MVLHASSIGCELEEIDRGDFCDAHGLLSFFYLDLVIPLHYNTHQP
jgi:hypothetical protein